MTQPSQSPLVIRPRLFDGRAGIFAGMSTRHGGFSPAPLGMNLSLNVGDAPENVHRNREFLFGTVGMRESDAAFAGQVHSGTVVRVDRPGFYPSCDALVTDRRGIALAVSVADCVPILIADEHVGVIAAVHAGWRGTNARIVVNAVETLRAEFGARPEDLLVWIGPAAASCCYEVGPEVAQLFSAETVVRNDGTTTLDLHRENRRQACEAGIDPGRIEVDDRCTITEAEVFHSFRRDGATSGRMLAFIGMRSQ